MPEPTDESTRRPPDVLVTPTEPVLVMPVNGHEEEYEQLSLLFKAANAACSVARQPWHFQQLSHVGEGHWFISIGGTRRTKTGLERRYHYAVTPDVGVSYTTARMLLTSYAASALFGVNRNRGGQPPNPAHSVLAGEWIAQVYAKSGEEGVAGLRGKRYNRIHSFEME